MFDRDLVPVASLLEKQRLRSAKSKDVVHNKHTPKSLELRKFNRSFFSFYKQLLLYSFLVPSWCSSDFCSWPFLFILKLLNSQELFHNFLFSQFYTHKFSRITPALVSTLVASQKRSVFKVCTLMVEMKIITHLPT